MASPGVPALTLSCSFFQRQRSALIILQGMKTSNVGSPLGKNNEEQRNSSDGSVPTAAPIGELPLQKETVLFSRDANVAIIGL